MFGLGLRQIRKPNPTFFHLSSVQEIPMSALAVAIIGTGWGARIQVPAFRAAGLEVLAIAGSQATKTERVANDLGIPVHTGNWRDLLAHDDIALLSIVTPPALHREMAVATLEAGKHVLCEKPTALNVSEAEAMAAAAEAHPQQIALIDHELRFLPAVRLARQMIGSGKLGRIQYAEVRLVGSSRSDLQRPWNWWSDATQGGGALGALGSHQIDLLRYLLQDEVVSAVGQLSTNVAERRDSAGTLRRVTSDDGAVALLRFAGGAVASFLALMTARNDEPNGVTLYGTEGTLRFAGGHLLHSIAGGHFADITPSHTVSFPSGITGDFPQATVYLGAACYRWLHGDDAALAPGATFADGLAVQRVIDTLRC
jgi:predicted dehydrogenase